MTSSMNGGMLNTVLFARHLKSARSKKLRGLCTLPLPCEKTTCSKFAGCVFSCFSTQNKKSSKTNPTRSFCQKMFGTPLPPPTFTATAIGSKNGKAVAQVPGDWVDQVQLLQSNQATSRIICLSGYLVNVMSGEKFNSDNMTLNICIPLSIWVDFANKWFPKVAGVALKDLDATVKDLPFKIPVKGYNEDNVQLNVKIHTTIFNEAFPKGFDGTAQTVNMCLQFFVYSAFGQVPTPGCSFKCGWIQTA